MAKLFYQGHGSYRITANDGRVIYVDPYAGDKESYKLPADIILVTHQHHDHNQTDLCAKKDGCKIITNAEALAGKTHNSFDVGGISIESVEAKNLMHNPKDCVGYIVTMDGIKIYAAGDTSKTEQMKTFAEKNIDYALFPCDGKFNMSLKEAAECAKIIGAKHNIPIHMSPGKLFSRERAEKFDAPNRLILEPNQEIEL
ncbi:MAG: MBL fold metallo-hydrolase [Oscillospiraceae bacterium]|nr:MBL fold metallo-hydrolase [Oscillospiraceae bacterium]